MPRLLEKRPVSESKKQEFLSFGNETYKKPVR